MALAEMAESALRPKTLGVTPAPVRAICVTSGKGGVGKTTVAVNLALALIGEGRSVMLLDADLGLANVNVMLGLGARRTLSDLLRGDCTLADLVISGPRGLQIVPSASGLSHMTRLGLAEQAGLVHAFSDLEAVPEVLLIDTAAGIGDSVCNFCVASRELVVTICPEPTSITDAYALIKVLAREHGVTRFHVLANMVVDHAHGERTFRQLARVAERFLQIDLDYAGCIPRDPWLEESIRRQRPVVVGVPDSPSAKAFRRLAKSLERWPGSESTGGNRLEFFMERLLQSRQTQAEHLS